jgi:GT2 family glycosyltransferase
MQKVFVVIPHYRGEKYLAACLQSVVDNHCPPENIVVVDNNSPGNHVEQLCKQFGKINLLRNEINHGFGKACNIGADFAFKRGARHILILNQDTIVSEGTIESLVRVLESNRDMAIAAPLLYKFDQRSFEPFFITWYISQCPEMVSDALEGNLKDFYPVKKVSGACMAVKAETIDVIGLFDPLYFMYCEDDDFCRRAKKCGYQTAIVPSAKVFHAHSHTAESGSTFIDQFKISSRIIYTLKDLDKSFALNSAKVIKMGFVDSLELLSHLHIKKWMVAMKEYFKILLQLSNIFASRLKEENIISKCRDKHE